MSSPVPLLQVFILAKENVSYFTNSAPETREEGMISTGIVINWNDCLKTLPYSRTGVWRKTFNTSPPDVRLWKRWSDVVESQNSQTGVARI